MRAQHSTSTTLTVSLIACVALLGALVLGADKLASSAPLTLVGGLLSSLLFFFLLTAVGSIEANAGIKYTRWAEVLLCLLVATVFASTVHRVCVTSCILFSAGILYYANGHSQRIHEAPATLGTAPSAKKPRKK